MNKTRNKNKHNNKITPAIFPISQDKQKYKYMCGIPKKIENIVNLNP